MSLSDDADEFESDPRARAKQIGETVEENLADRIDGLELADDDDAPIDAQAVDAIGAEAHPEIRLGSVCLLERGTQIEIKACSAFVSNGSGRTRGRFVFKAPQHEALLAEGGAYLLAVYRDELDPDAEALLAVPAAIIDVLLSDWYYVNREPERRAKIRWSRLMPEEAIE